MAARFARLGSRAHPGEGMSAPLAALLHRHGIGCRGRDGAEAAWHRAAAEALISEGVPGPCEHPEHAEIARWQRIEAAARALLHGSGDDPLPDDEWDPVFLALRDALEAKE